VCGWTLGGNQQQQWAPARSNSLPSMARILCKIPSQLSLWNITAIMKMSYCICIGLVSQQNLPPNTAAVVQIRPTCETQPNSTWWNVMIHAVGHVLEVVPACSPRVASTSVRAFAMITSDIGQGSAPLRSANSTNGISLRPKLRGSTAHTLPMATCVYFAPLDWHLHMSLTHQRQKLQTAPGNPAERRKPSANAATQVWVILQTGFVMDPSDASLY
jgi:hypothetical protein